MVVFSMYIINKAGGLIYQRDFGKYREPFQMRLMTASTPSSENGVSGEDIGEIKSSTTGSRKSAHLTSLKPTKDTSNALILDSYRSSVDSAALFDQLVFNQGSKSCGTPSSSTPMTPTQQVSTSVSATILQQQKEDKKQEPSEIVQPTADSQQQQQDKSVDSLEQTNSVATPQNNDELLDPSVTPVTKKEEPSTTVTVVDNGATIVKDENGDQWQEQEDDLETFDSETETDADFLLPFSKVETFDNEDFDLEDLLAFSELAEMENYEPNVDEQQLELYRTKLPRFFDFDPNVEDRKKKLITLLFNMLHPYNGLDRARGKSTNRKATIFSGVSPLQYQEFKKFSVEEAGKLIYRVFTEWWKLKNATNIVLRDGMTPEQQYNTIFSNIEQILKTNTALLHDLKMDFKMHYPKNHFPSIFKKILPFLKVYTVYVNNYEKANELVEELIARNPKFNEYVESVYKKKGVTLVC
ncbi:hypothetical protein C9374_013051 [Naegleria lovaniensis]|uniref:DH domain-containing protein n=1 Tax=Naegleria lovaniensis TaxID=51637 RepID=A0AA88GE44_NAELO|nr:uncharacterized protein C9374_013051 [Naegleria lovaniensis]KAG2372929.1 hypothetical protein C9374_013051 [Naegleria lovaniensis]